MKFILSTYLSFMLCECVCVCVRPNIACVCLCFCVEARKQPLDVIP